MILNIDEDENLNTHNENASGHSVPDLASWTVELREKIAVSEQEAASLRSRAEIFHARAETLLKMAQASDTKTKSLRDLLKHMENAEKSLGSSSTAKSHVTRGRASTLANTVRERAKEILKAAGHPLGRTEILAQLIDDGILITSAKPAQRVGKMLWESDEFEYRDKGYWIVGEPIAPGVKREKRFRAPNRKKKS